VQVIVVDDGSTDASLSVIRSFEPPVELLTDADQERVAYAVREFFDKG
jgi:glycosyltransferase involved in cell wall biosynthesis